MSLGGRRDIVDRLGARLGVSLIGLDTTAEMLAGVHTPDRRAGGGAGPYNMDYNPTRWP